MIKKYFKFKAVALLDKKSFRQLNLGDNLNREFFCENQRLSLLSKKLIKLRVDGYQIISDRYVYLINIKNKLPEYCLFQDNERDTDIGKIVMPSIIAHESKEIICFNFTNLSEATLVVIFIEKYNYLTNTI